MKVVKEERPLSPPPLSPPPPSSPPPQPQWEDGEDGDIGDEVMDDIIQSAEGEAMEVEPEKPDVYVTFSLTLCVIV